MPNVSSSGFMLFVERERCGLPLYLHTTVLSPDRTCIARAGKKGPPKVAGIISAPLTFHDVRGRGSTFSAKNSRRRRSAAYKKTAVDSIHLPHVRPLPYPWSGHLSRRCCCCCCCCCYIRKSWNFWKTLLLLLLLLYNTTLKLQRPYR